MFGSSKRVFIVEELKDDHYLCEECEKECTAKFFVRGAMYELDADLGFGSSEQSAFLCQKHYKEFTIKFLL